MAKNTPRNVKSLRKRLKKFLPEKISLTLSSYDEFANQTPPEDAKGFAAHHSACKAAISHTETLIKLLKWSNEEDTPQNSSEDIEIKKLIAEARSALSKTGEDYD